MKRLVFVLGSLLVSFVGWVVSHQWGYPIRYEWGDRAAPGSLAKSIQGSLTRQALYPRGLSLDVAFRDGVRFTWIGDASMAPVGLVERADGVYLVLQAWGRPHGEVVAGQTARHLVCQLRDAPPAHALQGGAVTPLFVPTDVPHNFWPWVSHVRVEPGLVDRFPRAAAGELAGQVAGAVAAGAGACPDLRRADHI
jgi:hypothetical protein